MHIEAGRKSITQLERVQRKSYLDSFEVKVTCRNVLDLTFALAGNTGLDFCYDSTSGTGKKIRIILKCTGSVCGRVRVVNEVIHLSARN